MTRLVSTLLSLAVLLPHATRLAAAEEPPRRDKAIRPTEVIQLFNGRDLSGFTTWLRDTNREDPRGVYCVVDGMIRISGDGYGGLITENAYRDYHLVVEFKWGKKTWDPRKDRTMDSGVLVHCAGAPGNAGGTWMASIECQVIEGGVGDFIIIGGKYVDGSSVPVSLTCEITKDRDGEAVWKKGGKRQVFHGGRVNWFGRDPDWEDVLGFRGKRDVESPAGEWTRLEVFCDGSSIRNYVNGIAVNEGFDAFPSAGRILLQSECAEIFFRKIELRPLESDSAKADQP